MVHFPARHVADYQRVTLLNPIKPPFSYGFPINLLMLSSCWTFARGTPAAPPLEDPELMFAPVMEANRGKPWEAGEAVKQADANYTMVCICLYIYICLSWFIMVYLNLIQVISQFS